MSQRTAAHGNSELDPIVEHADLCQGFLVSADGARIRLEFGCDHSPPWLLELPVSGIASLMKAAAEAQQAALPRNAGRDNLRVVRQPTTWSLERDLADDSLTLVFVTADGFQWCFRLADRELFRMAECLRDDLAVALPTAPGCQ